MAIVHLPYPIWFRSGFDDLKCELSVTSAPPGENGGFFFRRRMWKEQRRSSRSSDVLVDKYVRMFPRSFLCTFLIETSSRGLILGKRYVVGRST
jgi:hypothetical protein